jgi:Icc-related predicted phosphoesterase
MRVVAVADTHQMHHKLALPAGDLLVHAGDLTADGTLEELEAVRDWLRAQPHEHKVVIAGNHDFAFERTPDAARALLAPVAHYLEGSGICIEGRAIWGGPWQPWFHSWAFNLRRGSAIDAKWRQIPQGLDLLITHGPPLGFGDRIWSGDRVGCADLLRHVKEKLPRVHVFGHIHEDPGVWQLGATCMRNVTVADCTMKATVFDL